MAVSEELEDIILRYFKKTPVFWGKGSDAQAQLALYFPYRIFTGIKLDAAVCVVVLGNVTKDPLSRCELKEFANERSHPGVGG